ncbi:membrane protein [Arthrobacter phage Berrie]|uniref:Membrane protein n=1 Tax=Arthrobacter phage Berrie TaxID=2926087 RepID=A0ABZ2CN86_9CAUD
MKRSDWQFLGGLVLFDVLFSLPSLLTAWK